MTNDPPHGNGVMVLTDVEMALIKGKLNTIRSNFVPNEVQTICDTFYLVSTYNVQNVGSEINGDTADFILS